MKALFRKMLKRSIVALLVLIFLTGVSLLAVRVYLQSKIRKETKITSPNGIASLEEESVGCVKQWLLIRGHDKSKPVLLYLHGGPGGTLIPTFHLNIPLEREFVVVYWDQRGAGKSYSPTIPKESMNIEQFVSDTYELVRILRQRFGAPKVYLVGHSWGSILGMLAVKHYPDLFYAYVGIGQVANMRDGELLSYEFALNSATKTGNQQAIRELQSIGSPPYEDIDKLFTERKWVSKFGGDRYGKSDSRLWVYQLFFSSPYYSLFDLKKAYMGLNFSLKSLWNQENQVNLFQQVPRVEVPVYFLEGRYDYVVPSRIAERYYQALDAPKGKRLIWFEKSGHSPFLEESAKFQDVMINIVLKETLKN